MKLFIHAFVLTSITKRAGDCCETTVKRTKSKKQEETRTSQKQITHEHQFRHCGESVCLISIIESLHASKVAGPPFDLPSLTM